MDILDKCFVKKGDCVSREIAGETLIVPVRSHVGDVNAIYTMNELGTMIWGLVDGQTSVGQIIKAICTAYDVPPEKASEDAVAFLYSLKEAGLIGSAGS
jgi:hypothetical protein